MFPTCRERERERERERGMQEDVKWFIRVVKIRRLVNDWVGPAQIKIQIYTNCVGCF